MDPSPNTYDVGDGVQLSCAFLTLNTLGSVEAGTALLTVQDTTGYAASDPILVAGAGGVGGDLFTTVVSVSGSQIVLGTAASTTVSRVPVGKLTDPSTVACEVQAPGGSAPVVVTATKSSTGRYTASFAAALTGDHYVRWTGSGAVTGAEERQFLVREKRA